MAERSMFWNGAVTGDCGPYSSQQFMDYFWRVITNGTGNRGVLMNWLNELEVTDGGVNTATVATGASINYGLFYENDTAVNVNVPNGPRTDLIVVRRDWAAQTSRITRIAGPGAALVQNIGVTYDIPLASVDVTAGGALTITDTREYCQFSAMVPEDSIGEDTIQADAMTVNKMINQTRWITRGAGELLADATVPAQWVNVTTCFEVVYHDSWQFRDGQTDTVWATFRVPSDFTGATITVKVAWKAINCVVTGDIRWAFSAWVAAANGVLANQTGTATQTVVLGSCWISTEDMFTIGTIPVAAGNIVHVELYRNDVGAPDTFNGDCYVLLFKFEYTADN